jgi:energy-converting hydrogenase B subunit D
VIGAQVLVLVLIGVIGTVTVVTRDLVHQWLIFGLYGMLLSLGFLLLQAPDAALAQVVVSGIVVPLLLGVVLAEVGGSDT